MSYEVRYGSCKYDTQPAKKGAEKIIALVLLCAVVLTVLCFPAQVRELRRHALPFLEPEVRSAFSDMIGRIKEGESVSDAAEVFYQEILFAQAD